MAIRSCATAMSGIWLRASRERKRRTSPAGVQPRYVLLATRGFKPFYGANGRLGGERHGGWDWLWTRRPRRRRVEIVRVFAEPGQQVPWNVQIWSGLESADRYGTALIRAIPSDETGDRAVQPALDALDQAAAVASDFPVGLMEPIPIWQMTAPAEPSELVATYAEERPPEYHSRALPDGFSVSWRGIPKESGLNREVRDALAEAG